MKREGRRGEWESSRGREEVEGRNEEGRGGDWKLEPPHTSGYGDVTSKTFLYTPESGGLEVEVMA